MSAAAVTLRLYQQGAILSHGHHSQGRHKARAFLTRLGAQQMSPIRAKLELMRLSMRHRGHNHWPAAAPGVTHWPIAPPGQRRVLLHVGLHKTGTTALQWYLSVAADQLREQGVLYPASGRLSRGAPGGHHNIAWQLAGDRRFHRSAGTLDDVAAEIAAFPGDAILSCEDFESILGNTKRFVPLFRHDLLKDRAFTVVLWVREQASYIELLFFEMLSHRLTEEAARFCRSVLVGGQLRHEDWTFHFDNDFLATSLLRFPASVAVRPYSKLTGGSTISDFLAFARLDLNGDSRKFKRANVRTSVADLFSVFCQHRLHNAVTDRTYLSDVVAAVLKERAAHLSPRLRAALIARFSEGNCRLAHAYGFPAEFVAISPTPPESSIPLEGLFSLRMLSSLFAGSARDNERTTDQQTAFETAVEALSSQGSLGQAP